MADAKLKYDDREMTLGETVVSLGRATDNSVSFSSDSNVSRYHAEVEFRGGDYWLIDLGSSNGTTLNGEAIKGERKLNDGDEIAFGGTSKVSFVVADESKSAPNNSVPSGDDADAAAINAEGESESDAAEKEQEAEIAADEKTVSKSRMPLMLGIAGATVGLAVACVIGAVIYSTTGTTKCEAKAVIVSPEYGDALREKTDIEVKAENAECVSRAIFLLDGKEFDSTTEQPFKSTIDPNEHPELANGGLYSLQIALEDQEGNRILQPTDVAVQLETREIATPTPTPTEVAEVPTPTPAKNQRPSLIETKDLAKNFLTKDFPANANYNVSDPDFLKEVQKQTDAFAASEGYFARATAYRDVISVAFVQERNLDASLGFILAMSRSQFKPQRQGADEGLWQMSQNFAAENSLNGTCGTETLSDASQNCAAKAASQYLKSLVLEVFEGDVVYSVAAFGKSPQEANIWKATLPANRADFWKNIKDAKQREQVAKFFAAGMVAENPQKYGLKRDRPISELYKNLVGN